MGDNRDINLRDLICVVRNELEGMEKNRLEQKKDTLFQLKSMEIELSFVVENSDSAQGGIDLKIIKLGAAENLKTSEIQKIILKFEVPKESLDSHVIGLRGYHNGAYECASDISRLEES